MLPSRHKLFVYGTLMGGGINNKRHLSKAKFVGPTALPGYLIISINEGAYPGMVPANELDVEVVGEVYEVSNDELRDIDALEGVDHDFYQRIEVETEYGKGWTYILHPSTFAFQAHQRTLEMYLEGDFTIPETINMDEDDILTYVCHAYLVAAGLESPKELDDGAVVVVPPKTGISCHPIRPISLEARPIKATLGPGVEAAPERPIRVPENIHASNAVL